MDSGRVLVLILGHSDVEDVVVMLALIIAILGGFIAGVVTEKVWRWWSAHRLWLKELDRARVKSPLHKNCHCKIIPFPTESIGGGDA